MDHLRESDERIGEHVHG